MLTNQYLHRILDIKSVAHFSIDFRGLIFKPTFQQTGNHTAVSKQNISTKSDVSLITAFINSKYHRRVGIIIR